MGEVTTDKLNKKYIRNTVFSVLLNRKMQMAVYISKKRKGIKYAIKSIVNFFEKDLDFSKGILLKPNIVFPVKDKSGQITKIEVVRALIEILRDIKPGIKITIGEGVAAGAIAQENFRKSGYAGLADELGVPLLDFNEVEHIKIKWGYGALKIPKIALNLTYINLPILKRSSAALFSGAMKNQKGLILPQMKKAFHKIGLHKPLAELNKVVQPSLTIVDCINFSSEDLFIASNNTYEADKATVKFLGISEPDYLKIAYKLGVGKNDYFISGDQIDQAVLKSPIEYEEVRKFFRLRFRVSYKTCSMCRFLFQDLKKIKCNDFFLYLILYIKIICYAIRGAEIMLGCESKVLPESKKVICIGDCTKKLAKNNGYLHIAGCPPTRREILRMLTY